MEPLWLAYLLSGYSTGSCSAEDFPTGGLPKGVYSMGSYPIEGYPTGSLAVSMPRVTRQYRCCDGAADTRVKLVIINIALLVLFLHRLPRLCQCL